VFAIAGESLIFPFSHFFQLFRRNVFAASILGATIYATNIWFAAPLSNEPLSSNPVALSLYFLGLFALINLYTGVLQVTLESQNFEKWIHFGKDECRLTAYWVFYFSVCATVFLAFAMLNGTLASNEGNLIEGMSSTQSSGPLPFLLLFFLFPLLFWAYLRTFPIPAFIVAKKSLNLKAGWSVAQGNSLRIFGLTIVQGILFTLFVELPASAFGNIENVGGWRADFLNFLPKIAAWYSLIVLMSLPAIVYRHLAGESEEVISKFDMPTSTEKSHSAA